MERCTLVAGLILTLSAGCAFDPNVSNRGAADGGAGSSDAADPLSTVTMGREIDLSIGPGGAFPDFNSWKAARAGNLLQRQLMSVESTSNFLAGEKVTSTSGSCSGLFRAASATQDLTPIVTLDLNGAGCRVGDLLEAESGVTATVLNVGLVGVSETATFIGADIAAPMLIDAFRTSALHYLTIRASEQFSHGGQPGQGIAIASTDGQPHHGIEVDVSFTRIIGFEITAWAPNADENSKAHAVLVTAPDVILDRLLIHDDGSASVEARSDGVYSDRKNVAFTLRNSFIYNIHNAGVHIDGADNSNLNIENCSFANCMLADTGVDPFGCISAGKSKDSVLRIVNTVALSSGEGRTAFFLPSDAEGSRFSADSSNNATNSPVSPDFAVQIDDSEFVSLQSDSMDLHLVASDSPLAIGGMGLDSSFDHDIDGQPRNVTWSIGADQVAP